MIILFDGYCNLCNGFIAFVQKHDRKKIFEFASLQSNFGTEISGFYHLPAVKPETIVLYDGRKIFTESNAVIKIVVSLKGFWSVFIVFKLIPPFIRNWFYRLIAKNRYRIFGGL